MIELVVVCVAFVVAEIATLLILGRKPAPPICCCKQEGPQETVPLPYIDDGQDR